jgi:hypothetical protein
MAARGEGWSSPEYRVSATTKVTGPYAPGQPNNWGRWGEDDRRGTANFIDAEDVRAAAGLVRTGQVYSLAHAIGPASAPHSVIRPRAKHYSGATGTDSVPGSPSNPYAPAHGGETSDAFDVGRPLAATFRLLPLRFPVRG